MSASRETSADGASALALVPLLLPEDQIVQIAFGFVGTHSMASFAHFSIVCARGGVDAPEKEKLILDNDGQSVVSYLMPMFAGVVEW